MSSQLKNFCANVTKEFVCESSEQDGYWGVNVLASWNYSFVPDESYDYDLRVFADKSDDKNDYVAKLDMPWVNGMVGIGKDGTSVARTINVGSREPNPDSYQVRLYRRGEGMELATDR